MGPPGTGERQLGTQQHVPWPRPRSGDMASGQVCDLRMFVCTGFSQPWRIALPVGCVTAERVRRLNERIPAEAVICISSKAATRFYGLHGKQLRFQCHHYPFWGLSFNAVVPLQTRRKILGFARRMSIDFRRQHLIALLASNEESRLQLFANAEKHEWLSGRQTLIEFCAMEALSVQLWHSFLPSRYRSSPTPGCCGLSVHAAKSGPASVQVFESVSSVPAALVSCSGRKHKYNSVGLPSEFGNTSARSIVVARLGVDAK